MEVIGNLERAFAGVIYPNRLLIALVGPASWSRSLSLPDGAVGTARCADIRGPA